MGNDQNKKNTDVQIELNHSKINTVRVVNDIKKRYMQAVFGAEQSDYDAWKQNIQNSKANTDYLLWPFHHQFGTKALCGTTGTVKVNYDNYPYLLIQQIENRRAKKKRFDETELWQLLFCLVEAQKQMTNGNNSRVGDIRPHNVFLNEQGNIKVANLLSWPKQTTNYQKFLENQITYLAPEDMKFVESSSLDNQSNKLSQIFSIGLTVLSAANLTDYRKLYDTKSLHFNLEQFARTLHEWKLNDVYSDIFKATICSLIEINHEQRMSEYEIEPWIQKYRNQILSQQDFIINDPPQKINSQIGGIRKIYESAGFHLQNIQPNQPIAPLVSVVPATEHHRSIINANTPNINFTLQGSRRLLDQKRLPPISMIPGTTAVQSIYQPNDRFTSNFIVPGVNTNAVLSESTYKSTWQINNISIQGGIANSTYLPKTNFEYKTSPVTNHLKKAQGFQHEQALKPLETGQNQQIVVEESPNKKN